MARPEVTCLHCVSWQDQYDLLIQDYEIVGKKLRAAERENLRLTRELNGSTTKETQELKDFLQEWDRIRRKLFQTTRDVNMDPAGSRAKAVRAAKRRGWTHEGMIEVVRGAAFDAGTAQNRTWFDVENLLRNDKFMELHQDRYRDYLRLKDAGFKNPVQLVRNGIGIQARQGTPEWWVEHTRQGIIQDAMIEEQQKKPKNGGPK